MTERTYNLPDDFYDGKPAEVNFYFYQSNESSKNNKINFKQNLLCFILEGQKEVFSSNSSISVGTDKVLLLQAGNVLMSEKTTNSGTYKSVLVFFSDNFLLKFVADKKIKTDTNNIGNRSMNSLLKDSYIYNFENSLLLCETALNKNRELALAKLEEILIYLLETNATELTHFIQNALNRKKHHLFSDIINSQTNPNLTVEELAFLCNMSVSTFKRKFSEVYHTTPKQYFIEQKMNQAVFLLKQYKRPSEIYFELGYENLSAFSREFKKHIGVSPRTYSLQS